MDERDHIVVQEEIVVHLKQTSDGRSNPWETAERISRIVSAVAIPIVLAVVGFVVQRRLQNQTVQREYVSLAVSILQETDEKKAPAELKQWAATLLDQNAPVKLPPRLLTNLQSGNTTLPISGGLVSGSIIISPDNIHRGESTRLSWNSFNATSVVITPDIGNVPLSGSIAVSPIRTTTYTLTISNSRSSTNGTATVFVSDSSDNGHPRQKPTN
jgi:hypothetical protein